MALVGEICGENGVWRWGVRQGRRPTAAALPRPGGSAPRDPLTRALGLLVFWWDVGAAVWGVGRVVVGAVLFGVWVIGEAVFWRSPNAAPWGGIGGAQRIREVGSATLLRLVAPPGVSAAHRLLARTDAGLAPTALPVRFREPMGGESGDGGYGVTGATG